jgi:hypothetical protein
LTTYQLFSDNVWKSFKGEQLYDGNTANRRRSPFHRPF